MYSQRDEGFRVDLNGQTYLVKISQSSQDKLLIEAVDYNTRDSYMGEFEYNSLCEFSPCFRIYPDATGIKSELSQAVESGMVEIFKDTAQDIVSLKFNLSLGVDEAPFICELLRPITQGSIPPTRPQETLFRPSYTQPPKARSVTEYPPDSETRSERSITEYPPDEKEIERGSKLTSYIKNKYYEEKPVNFAFDKFGTYSSGLVNSIIKDRYEIEPIMREIEARLRMGVRYNLLYKGSVHGDDPMMFHNKCDYHDNTLVLVMTENGARFGGFTTQSWDGEYIKKKDDEAFVFSLNSKPATIYKVSPGKDAIGCYPEYGPVFMGCQIRIYPDFFTRGGTTCARKLNYPTEQDYELANGEQKFNVKDVEVYECLTD